MLYVYNSCNDEWVVERERERVSNRRANKSFFLSSSSVFVCFLRRFSSSIEVSSFFLVTCCVVRSEVQCGWVSRIILVHNTHTLTPSKGDAVFWPLAVLHIRRSTFKCVHTISLFDDMQCESIPLVYPKLACAPIVCRQRHRRRRRYGALFCQRSTKYPNRKSKVVWVWEQFAWLCLLDGAPVVDGVGKLYESTLR